MTDFKRPIAISAFALLVACSERDTPAANEIAGASANPVTNEAPIETRVDVAAPVNAATSEAPPPAPAPATLEPAPLAAAACGMQEGKRLTMTPLRAIGTEPFWGARIEGRCVTYSTPEDQAGTRIWTKYTPGPDGGIWSGALDGRQFELRTRPAPPPGCSDGMSDNRYPHGVTLRVRGETRTGCARPL